MSGRPRQRGREVRRVGAAHVQHRRGQQGQALALLSVLPGHTPAHVLRDRRRDRRDPIAAATVAIPSPPRPSRSHPPRVPPRPAHVQPTESHPPRRLGAVAQELTGGEDEHARKLARAVQMCTAWVRSGGTSSEPPFTTNPPPLYLTFLAPSPLY